MFSIGCRHANPRERPPITPQIVTKVRKARNTPNVFVGAFLSVVLVLKTEGERGKEGWLGKGRKLTWKYRKDGGKEGKLIWEDRKGGRM